MVPLKFTRQRYVLAADQVFTLSSVEVESASKQATGLRSSPLSFSCTTSAPINDVDGVRSHAQRRLSLRHKVEDCLWLASAFFILYYGDFRSDFFTLLVNDVRVWRTPLHMGLTCLMLDGCLMMLYMAMSVQGEQEGWLQAPAVIQAVTMLGCLAFMLLSVALWPIWNFLTVPMLFTLFMAFMVVAPYVLPKVKLDVACPSSLYVHSSCEHEKASTL